MHCPVSVLGSRQSGELDCFRLGPAPKSPCFLSPVAELMGRTLHIDAATSDAEAKSKAAKPVDGCWFCLSNPNADVELVASVGALCSPPGTLTTGLQACWFCKGSVFTVGVVCAPVSGCVWQTCPFRHLCLAWRVLSLPAERILYLSLVFWSSRAAAAPCMYSLRLYCLRLYSLYLYCALRALRASLITGAGEECYVALDKGAITEQHVLVLPVEHFPCSLAAPTSATEEMQRWAWWPCCCAVLRCAALSGDAVLCSAV